MKQVEYQMTVSIRTKGWMAVVKIIEFDKVGEYHYAWSPIAPEKSQKVLFPGKWEINNNVIYKQLQSYFYHVTEKALLSFLIILRDRKSLSSKFNLKYTGNSIIPETNLSHNSIPNNKKIY
jgi:hypothetical protein